MAPDRTSGDLVDLLRRYVRQETTDPLRSLGRFLVAGVAGSILMGVGVVLLGTGALRLLQDWSVLDGSWSWVPYLVVAVVLIGVAVVAAGPISVRPSSGEGARR